MDALYAQIEALSVVADEMGFRRSSVRIAPPRPSSA